MKNVQISTEYSYEGSLSGNFKCKVKLTIEKPFQYYSKESRLMGLIFHSSWGICEKATDTKETRHHTEILRGKSWNDLEIKVTELLVSIEKELEIITQTIKAREETKPKDKVYTLSLGYKFS